MLPSPALSFVCHQGPWRRADLGGGKENGGERVAMGDVVALMTTEEAARWLRSAPRTLERWRHSGKGPKYIRLTPRCVRYRLADLEAWATANEVGEPAAGRRPS
jgi:hypothetical protein